MGLATGLILGGMLVKGITDVVGAKKASSAAKKATEQQVTAGQQGQQVIQQYGERGLAGLQPYNQIGQQALGGMASMMGLPGIMPTAPAGMPPQQAGPGQRLTPPGTPVIGHAMPRPGMGTIGSMAGAAPSASSYRMATNQPIAPGFTQNTGVWLRAPTGETIQVDPAQAEHYIQRGAQRVS